MIVQQAACPEAGRASYAIGLVPDAEIVLLDNGECVRVLDYVDRRMRPTRPDEAFAVAYEIDGGVTATNLLALDLYTLH